MSSSNGMDNVLSGILGALEGVQRGIQPYAQMNLYKAQKQFDNQSNLDYMQQALPIQSQNEMNTFKQKLPLETAAKIQVEQAKPDETSVFGPDGNFIKKVTGKVAHLGYPPGSGNKVDTRTIGQIKAAGEFVPEEFQSTPAFDGYRIQQATNFLMMRGLEAHRQDADQTSAGKTGIFQGIRNSFLGIPGMNQNQKSGSIADSILKKHGIHGVQ